MPSWEWIVVGIIVAAAVVWGVRAATRSIRSGSVCSDCSDAGSCPLVKNPDLIDELREKNAKNDLQSGKQPFSNCKHLPD